MKEEPSADKLRGGFYTPQPIADFLASWAIQSPNDKILEPSCGDGVFLESAIKVLMNYGISRKDSGELLHAVEYVVEEMEKAKIRLVRLGCYVTNDQIVATDFFEWAHRSLRLGQLFDVVVGNPPFIRYQNFQEEHRIAAFRLMNVAGLKPNRLTNAWLPFLVVSSLLLKETGRLAMVIPTELFQVNYASETRRFLSEYFSRITIITFKKLVFTDVQQEVVLLLAERNDSEQKGIRTIELNEMRDLESYSHHQVIKSALKPIDHNVEKWTKYFLDTAEILLLRSLRMNPSIPKVGEAMEVDVGIVTGQNSFFIVNRDQLRKAGLMGLPNSYLAPIVCRSAQLNGAAYSKSDLLSDVKKQLPTYLFTTPSVELEKLPTALQMYIKSGMDEGYHLGYKCRIRKLWYTVPSVWVPDAFALRQVHLYPKLIYNNTTATSTDTIHRVRFLKQVNGKQTVASFLNSLTLAFSEITGRSYGGGVLTFEPSEVERLPLPLEGSDNLDISQIDACLRENRTIDEVLDNNDELLLRRGLGLSMKEIKTLRHIWEKLRDRRINRKH